MNITIQNHESCQCLQPHSRETASGRKAAGPRASGWSQRLLLWVAGMAIVLLGVPAAQAQREPANCSGSGLGIALFTSVPDVHIGDTISYSVNVFNGIAGSGRIVCDATEIDAFIVTPDGRTNAITLVRRTLHQGESDFYPDVVSYVVRAQDIQPDGTLLATARDIGTIHQNDTNSRGGGFQGVNTEVNIPCVGITALCVAGVGENGAILFSGTVTNCGNNTLVGVTVTNLTDSGAFTVLFPTNLARGQSAAFTGSWVPSNPCAPSTAVLTVRATDEFTATPRTVTASATVVCQNATTPGISVTKVCPAGPVEPGQLLVFTGTVVNTGNITLTNIVVLNNQPAANTPVFTLASLPPGGVANFTGSYLAPTNCSVTDTLTATASSRCGVAVAATASATCPILTTPVISVTAVCPSTPLVPGGTVVYRGTVRNDGNITLKDIRVLSDRPSANTPVFTLATLAPGASADFTANVAVPATTVCQLVTTFSASGNDACTLNTVIKTVSTTCTVTMAPAIAVTLACPAAPAATGGSISFTGTVRNSGNVTLNNVAVVNNQASPTTVFTVASLAPGASANFTATFLAPADACSVSTSVTASGNDGCTAALVTSDASATCALVTTPRIALTQICPSDPVAPGGVVTFTGTVRNDGDITLTNVVVRNDRSGTTPVLTVATLAPGAVVSFTGTHVAPVACSITSVSTASGSSVCGVSVNTTVTTVCPIVTAPNIEVTQTCPFTPVSPGGVLGYTGTVRNTGNITLNNVVVVNDRSGNTPIFTIASLAPGASADFSGSYVTRLDCCVDFSTIKASGQDCSGVTVTATTTRTCTLLTLPAIVVTKVCPPQPLEPGDLLRYSGSVSNAGNITLLDVTIVNTQSGDDLSVLGPLTLAPGESVAYAGSYIVPADFCGSDTVTARGFDSCTDSPVSNSVTTACRILTSPRIALRQSCPPQPTARGGMHTFTGTVSNPGNVTLTNVFVLNNQPAPNTAVIGPITLAPGQSVDFTGSYQAPAACCDILNTLSASGRDRCAGTTVSATSSALCPLLSTPVIAITRVCPPTSVPQGGVYAFKGTVRNTGDVLLLNVFVHSSQPATTLTWHAGATTAGVSLASLSAQSRADRMDATLADPIDCMGPNLARTTVSMAGNNTAVLGPIDLAPGESREFSGSYVVTAGSNPAQDTVRATAIDSCLSRPVSAMADCSGPVTQSTAPVISAVTLNSGMVQVSWTSTPGVTYQLQSKNASQEAWVNVPGTVTAIGTNATKEEPKGSSRQTFYRVRIVSE